MLLKNSSLKNLITFKPYVYNDQRGNFIKIYSEKDFNKEIGKFNCLESYYTISKKNVIRGMHFQIPPFDHSKIVYVIEGLVLDVILDIRKNSPTFGKFHFQKMSGNNHKCIYIPKGFAHGFKVISKKAVVNYLQSNIYSPKHDCGIHYDSFGFNWEILNPVISDRDNNFPKFKDYKTPFKFTNSI